MQEKGKTVNMFKEWLGRMFDILLGRKAEDTATQAMPWDAPWYMAGTEGTGEYVVLFAGPEGRVGVRELSSSEWRVRVEPANEAAAEEMRAFLPEKDWKQPGQDDQFRFSRVIQGDQARARSTAGMLREHFGWVINPDLHRV